MGNRNHGRFLKKITDSGLVCLLFAAGLPLPAAAEESCKDWNTAKFFESATVDEVRACLSAGRDPNEVDRKGLTALHRATRDTYDPAVIEVLLDAGANPRVSSRAGRTPWYYARTNGKIKGTAAYERLRIASAPANKRVVLTKKAARKADWSRVQEVPHSTKTAVRLYQDAAPRGSWKIKGCLYSATTDSITLMLKNGQTRTFPKTAVRKVLVPRPLKKRKPGWITLAVTMSLVQVVPRLMAAAQGVSEDLETGIAWYHLFVVAPATLAAFSVSRMGPIYDVPPEHRMLPQGDKQPGDQDNTSGKQEDPRGIE